MHKAPLTFSANLTPSRKILSLLPPSIKGNHQSQQIKNPIQSTPQNPNLFRRHHRLTAQPLSSEAMADQNPGISRKSIIISSGFVSNIWFDSFSVCFSCFSTKDVDIKRARGEACWGFALNWVEGGCGIVPWISKQKGGLNYIFWAFL